MASMMSKLSPTITNMIRMDHTHVMAAFHQFQPDSPARVKKGLADNICLALEVHAQLEEEIFYPALREVSPDAVLDKAKPEHDEMRSH
ncbi:MAG: hemerythrin domain-containing protein, partial [Comamonadaceae bacterium]